MLSRGGVGPRQGGRRVGKGPSFSVARSGLGPLARGRPLRPARALSPAGAGPAETDVDSPLLPEIRDFSDPKPPAPVDLAQWARERGPCGTKELKAEQEEFVSVRCGWR